jgi:hypothetical protein
VPSSSRALSYSDVIAEQTRADQWLLRFVARRAAPGRPPQGRSTARSAAGSGAAQRRRLIKYGSIRHSVHYRYGGAGRAHPPLEMTDLGVLRRDRLDGLIHEYSQVA